MEAKHRALVENFIKPAVKDQRVIHALLAVPRHLFVPEHLWAEAYRDHALPIGANQTISQPSLVAQMTELLRLTGKEKVLEIGTGSGYQAAILSKLAKQVCSIERLSELVKLAQQNLDRAKITNVLVSEGDGTQGLPQHAPFDAIIVTASASKIPQPLIDQLKEGGRLVMPVKSSEWGEHLVVGTKHEGKLETEHHTPVAFVPLISDVT
jgi:protein-L-isoaspartate(D-aspartate) O-methyltransferase